MECPSQVVGASGCLAQEAAVESAFQDEVVVAASEVDCPFVVVVASEVDCPFLDEVVVVASVVADFPFEEAGATGCLVQEAAGGLPFQDEVGVDSPFQEDGAEGVADFLVREVEVDSPFQEGVVEGVAGFLAQEVEEGYPFQDEAVEATERIVQVVVADFPFQDEGEVDWPDLEVAGDCPYQGGEVAGATGCPDQVVVEDFPFQDEEAVVVTGCLDLVAKEDYPFLVGEVVEASAVGCPILGDVVAWNCLVQEVVVGFPSQEVVVGFPFLVDVVVVEASGFLVVQALVGDCPFRVARGEICHYHHPSSLVCST